MNNHKVIYQIKTIIHLKILINPIKIKLMKINPIINLLLITHLRMIHQMIKTVYPIIMKVLLMIYLMTKMEHLMIKIKFQVIDLKIKMVHPTIKQIQMNNLIIKITILTKHLMIKLIQMNNLIIKITIPIKHLITTYLIKKGNQMIIKLQKKQIQIIKNQKNHKNPKLNIKKDQNKK